MNLISKNVVPGKRGKVFQTNATKQVNLEKIRDKILELKGIEDVKINLNTFPKEFTVYSSKLVSIEDIEKMVITTGFHALPKDTLEI